MKKGREEFGGIIVTVYCSCQYWNGWYNGVFLTGCHGRSNFVAFIRLIMYAYSRFHTSYNLDRYTVIQVKSYT